MTSGSWPVAQTRVCVYIAVVSVASLAWSMGCGGSRAVTAATPSEVPAPAQPSGTGPVSFDPTPRFVSKDINSHQGYATDGRFHYTIDTARIDKRLDNAEWSIVAANSSPFAGLPDSYNHLGDGDVYQGRLYVPAERWVSCASFGTQSILVFDAESLTRVGQFDISGEGHEVSAAAVDPFARNLYVASYCDPRRVFRYSLDTLSFREPIPLSVPISLIQGIAYRDGYLYVSSDATKTIYAIEPKSGRVEPALTIDLGTGNYEGLDVRGAELRWLIDLSGVNRRVYSFGIVANHLQ
jgi:hypothetical protein